MPLEFIPIKNEENWSGFDWTIVDEDELATMLARVALGQYRHILRILRETECATPGAVDSAFTGARKLLTVTDDYPWHRDGWVFQVISWIAAHKCSNGELIAPPHMQHADKGFDGLHVHIDKDSGAVKCAVLCEEKATGNPRSMIRDEVWPEFELFEDGTRDNELVARVTTLLETQTDIDPEQAIATIFWDEARAYRVSITVGNTHNSDAGRNRLFKDYEDSVTGECSRRRAETLYLADLRGWMESISAKAIDVLDALEVEYV